MGYYIGSETNRNKGNYFEQWHDAKFISHPASFAEVPVGQILICIKDNGIFEAAAVIYSEDEFCRFSDPNDTRPTEWLVMPSADVFKLNPAVAKEFEQETAV